MTTAEAPWSRTYLMVGMAARMRRSLEIAPSASSGTLKSTRIRTRWPARSFRSARVFFVAMPRPHSKVSPRSVPATGAAGRSARRLASRRNEISGSALGDHELEQVHAAVRVAPLVVVPAHQLEEPAVQLDARAGVE